uniref:Uncharacterized protein n=1 Tax=Oryza meridionalis TaxID=40149 RepID=A0A0E0DPM5_9ORYZ
MAAATATAPAASVTAATFSPSLPLLSRHQLPRGHRGASTVAFAARRFRGVNPSSDRPRGRRASVPAAPTTSAARDDGGGGSIGALEAELWRLQRRAELRLHRLAAEADEAYRDLRYSARVVGGDRVVLTFRRSSLRFAAAALLWSLALSAAAWALLGWAVRAWQRRGLGWRGGEGAAVVRRRDRSLGGKEVVVAVSSSPVAAPVSRVPEPAREVRRREPKGRLPEWWPELGEEVVVDQEPGMEKWARLANRLVRAIIDNRITGKDYKYDDAIQLRQLCKISGVKVSFDTENARDSFYRAAINFVLDDCSRAAQDIGAAQISGENPRNFLAGLASNIGLDKFRAATLALEMQGKRSEALDELSKICRIHNMFPPEENSAEMEMVAGGLKKNLQVAERVHLLSLYRSICTAGNIRTAAEALGLFQLLIATTLFGVSKPPKKIGGGRFWHPQPSGLQKRLIQERSKPQEQFQG